MGLKNPERERFRLAFQYIFVDCSDTMVTKCWRRIAVLPPTLRFALIESLWAVAKGKAEANNERAHT